MPEQIAVWFAAICEVFQDDLDRQEDLLALCKAQGRAALDHDVELLEARTEAITVLLADALTAERRRVALAEDLVRALALPLDRQTLSGLIDAAPSPWKQRLEEFQQRMRAVLAETREVVRANNQIMRRSAKIVGEALDALVQCVPGPQGQYDAKGTANTASPAGIPAIIDRRG